MEVKDYVRLSHKQKLFVVEYLIDLDSKAAAVRAGFTEERAGAWLMRHRAVRIAIDVELEKRRDRMRVTADNVIKEMAKIAFVNLQDFLKTDENGDAYVSVVGRSRDELAGVGSIKIKRNAAGEPAEIEVKLLDKKGALSDLAKHLGLFRDQYVQIDDGPVKIDAPGLSGLLAAARNYRTQKLLAGGTEIVEGEVLIEADKPEEVIAAEAKEVEEAGPKAEPAQKEGDSTTGVEVRVNER